MAWYKYDDGRSLGGTGSECGVVLRDDEHGDGARITLERDGGTAPFAITCGIYGWMLHTRFFGSEAEAQVEFDTMAAALAELVVALPVADSEDLSGMTDAISAFVVRFP